jgi:hypothetical protein
MITITTDNTEIYNFLEIQEKVFGDFDCDHVLGFDLDDDFYLIIYQAHNRDFIMWKATGVKQSASALLSLCESVELYEGLSVSVTDAAMKLMEDRIISGAGSHFYFDAH